MKTDTVQPVNRGREPGNSSQILLLDDDGRMIHLLERVIDPAETVEQSGVLEGIAWLGRNQANLVLLNIERLGRRTESVAKALKSVGNFRRLVLYGEAYAESYARAALTKGADEYLVWPVPLKELRSQLNGVAGVAAPEPAKAKTTARQTPIPPRQPEPVPEPPQPAREHPTPAGEPVMEKVSSTMPVQTAKILERYEYLAQLIPQGVNTLIEEIEKVLAELLQVEWVRIVPLNRADEQSDKLEKAATVSRVLPLVSFSGHFGKVIVGPPLMQAPALDPYQVTGFIATVLQLAQRDEALRHLAMTDELTGAHNRRYLELFVTKVIEQSQQQNTELTLFLFDIDEFKHYNDHYGHSAGDDILLQATKLIRRCCREHDIVARIGGDEFAVLFWDSDRHRQRFSRHSSGASSAGEETASHQRHSHSEMAMMLINRFRRLMMSNEFPSLGPEARRGLLTISGGLASYPIDGLTVQELLSAADEALLQAKRCGKNRVYLVGQPDENRR